MLDYGAQGAVIPIGRWENTIHPGCKLSMSASVDQFLSRRDRCFWAGCAGKTQRRGMAIACTACGLEFYPVTLMNFHEGSGTSTETLDSLKKRAAYRRRLEQRSLHLGGRAEESNLTTFSEAISRDEEIAKFRRIHLLEETETEHHHGANYDTMRALLYNLKSHPSAKPFLLPFDKDYEPFYYLIIKEPMDLLTIEGKLEADVYVTVEDLIRDVKLLLSNCRTVKEEGHLYIRYADRFERFMWQIIKDVPEWARVGS
jgi:hypothetical protein